MPRRLELSPHLPALLTAQDAVLSVRQAFAHGLTPDAVQHRIDIGLWQRVLPGVLLTHDQTPTRRQRLYATRLWIGRFGAVDGACAAHWHTVTVPGFDPDVVHVVVPYDHPARTTAFVRVRRSHTISLTPGKRWMDYVDIATAVVVAARDVRNERAVTAMLARPLQQGQVTVDDLLAAHMHAPPRGSRLVGSVLAHLVAGVRSAGELDAARLFAASRVLPPPEWNVWLRLPDRGPLISPDGLIEDAGMVIEINGRTYHAWGLAFEATEARQLRLEAAGITVAPLTPGRIASAGPQALRELEAVYRRLAGRGVPPGVEIIRGPVARAA